MDYHFDEVINRRHTDCLKYDGAALRGKDPDPLSLWVADMDFRTAPGITERLKEIAGRGIYGYSEPEGNSYFKAVQSWYARRFGFQTEPGWLIRTPGIVFAIATAVRAYTEPGDAVLVQRPVYYPFSNMVEKNGRIPVNNPLVLKDGRYEIDFEDMERKITENHVKLFLLCSPHNPVGRVWSEEELRKMADLCVSHGVVILSDEIHSDFVYRGHRHHVLSALSEKYAACTVTCTAPSKTFNLAGLQISNLFIPDPVLRERFQTALQATGYGLSGVFALAGAQAAYEEGEDWLTALLSYLEDNLDFVRSFVQERMPKVQLIEPEGTYLLWLDFRALGLSGAELDQKIEKEAGVWLDGGTMFGPEGEGFQRINIACPRSILEKAMERLAEIC